MFDIVFIFFLFLIGVTCVLYYLPPTVRKSRNRAAMRNQRLQNSPNNAPSIENYETYTYQKKCRRNTYSNELADATAAAADCDDKMYYLRNSQENFRSSNNQNSPHEDTVVRINENFMRHTCNCNNRNVNINSSSNKSSNISGITLMQIKPSEPQLIEVEIERTNSLSCYVKAKDFDIRDCNGPVFDV